MKKDLFEIRLKEDLENRWLCVGFRPAYEYVDDKRTERVIGVTYTCLHAQVMAGGMFDIKVLNQKPVISQDDISESGCFISFDRLTFVEWTDRRSGARRTSGRADAARRA